jgi:CheY-like chemotaxis protein
MLKEPGHDQPTSTQINHLHNEYVITRQLADVPGVRPVYAKEGSESRPVLLLEYIQGQDMSELIQDEPRKEILAAGCDDVVRKPFRDQEIFDVMTIELGVKYIYRDRSEAPAQPEGMELSAQTLAELPPELLQELRQTTLVLDREATLEVIERIEEHAPETAAGLRALVHSFQMGRFRELLGEMEG